MSVRSVFIRTAPDGTYTYERDLQGRVRAVEVLLQDLSTPDITVTDGVYGTSVYSGVGVASDAVAAMDVAVMGTLKVVVTGAGDTKKGRLNVLVDL